MWGAVLLLVSLAWRELAAFEVTEELWKGTENIIDFFTHYPSPHRTEPDWPSDEKYARSEKRGVGQDLKNLLAASTSVLKRAEESVNKGDGRFKRDHGGSISTLEPSQAPGGPNHSKAPAVS